MISLTKTETVLGEKQNGRKAPKTTDDILFDLRTSIGNMLESVYKKHRPRHQDLRSTWAALETIPFTTDEYHDTEKRIQNAVEYVKQIEYGAAQYELDTLLRRLPKVYE